MQEEVRVIRKKDGRVLHVPLKVALSSDFRKKGNVIDDPNYDANGNRKAIDEHLKLGSTDSSSIRIKSELTAKTEPTHEPKKKAPRKKKATAVATTKIIDPLKD